MQNNTTQKPFCEPTMIQQPEIAHVNGQQRLFTVLDTTEFDRTKTIETPLFAYARAWTEKDLNLLLQTDVPAWISRQVLLNILSSPLAAQSA